MIGKRHATLLPPNTLPPDLRLVMQKCRYVAGPQSAPRHESPPSAYRPAAASFLILARLYGPKAGFSASQKKTGVRDMAELEIVRGCR